jgi:hypothetical protein
MILAQAPLMAGLCALIHLAGAGPRDPVPQFQMNLAQERKGLLPLGNFNQHLPWVFTEVPQEAMGETDLCQKK